MSILIEDEKKPLKIVISGASHPASIFLIKYILNGEIYGKDMPIILHLLEGSDKLPLIRALEMELEDCGFILLKKLLVTSNNIAAYKDMNIIFMLSESKDQKEVFKVDTFRNNLKHFKRHAEIINEHADKRVKIIMCSRPINTNCLVMSKYAPNIPVENITGIIRLDVNRAQAQLAAELGVPCNTIRRIIIWGNYSDTKFTDISYAMVKLPDTKEMSIQDAIKNDNWIKNHFIRTIQTRTADPNFSGSGKMNFYMSLAKAIMDHSYDMWNGTTDWINMIVYSKGQYDAPVDVFFSFPVTIRKGKWYVVENLHVDEFSRSKLEITSKQIEQEKRWALTECG